MEGGGVGKVGSPEDSAARRAQESHLCRICKRGFTTAQALGGHMNVHRRREAEEPPAAGAQVDSGRSGGGGSQKAGPGGKSNDEVDLELRLWF